MTKLKNIFGIPQSLIDAANQIHETSNLVGKQKKIDANKNGKIDAHDFKILRNKNNNAQPTDHDDNTKHDSDTLKNKNNNAQPIDHSRRPKYPFPPGSYPNPKPPKSRYPEQETYPKPPKSRYNVMYKEESISSPIVEVSGTYPFKANDIAPFLVMLRSILSSLTTLPGLKKIMKEETGLDEENIESLMNFFEVLHEELDLLEYRTKGAVGKKKKAAAASTASSAPAPKKSEDDEEEEDEGPAYQPASGKDQEHIMTQLKGAMDDERGGRHIDTASGKKYVSKATARKIHSHLMGLKAPERAQSSSDLYNLKATHPMTKHIQDDHRAALEKGIKAPSDKKGRGRPKKVVD